MISVLCFLSMSDEDREEGVPPSKTTLCGEHESQTKAQSPEQQHSPHSAGPGPGPGPGPSCLSMKSNKSIDIPLHFRQSVDRRIQQQRPDSPGPSCLSLKSNDSKNHINFKGQQPSAAKRRKLGEPEPSCVSMKSDKSRDIPLLFKQSVDGRIQQQRPDSPGPSCLSLKSDESKDLFIDFKGRRPSADQIVDQESSEVPSGQSAQQHQTHLDSIFMLLEENIVTFVKKELKKMQKVLSPDYPECLESQREDEEVLDGEDEEQRRSSREAVSEDHTELPEENEAGGAG
ncbi:uncharacterized protein LOC127140878 isoform X2 [Lates calcarifer]|uniref:Uncharacterized protein LOC127140878 isoform X2 n=1 Tax=Lates calcarifer TaxID=8187 RepID=A0AAJ8DMQ8_LATCA|nr:uncharacterized protein LOC127140878 isoform X2 [Lates calcarifer]